jgi:hypothetical protein
MKYVLVSVQYVPTDVYSTQAYIEVPDDFDADDEDNLQELLDVMLDADLTPTLSQTSGHKFDVDPDTLYVEDATALDADVITLKMEVWQ